MSRLKLLLLLLSNLSRYLPLNVPPSPSHEIFNYGGLIPIRLDSRFLVAVACQSPSAERPFQTVPSRQVGLVGEQGDTRGYKGEAKGGDLFFSYRAPCPRLAIGADASGR